MRARDQCTIFSTGGKFRPDYGLLLELHALTLAAHSYALLQSSTAPMSTLCSPTFITTPQLSPGPPSPFLHTATNQKLEPGRLGNKARLYCILTSFQVCSMGIGSEVTHTLWLFLPGIGSPSAWGTRTGPSVTVSVSGA